MLVVKCLLEGYIELIQSFQELVLGEVFMWLMIYHCMENPVISFLPIHGNQSHRLGKN